VTSQYICSVQRELYLPFSKISVVWGSSRDVQLSRSEGKILRPSRSGIIAANMGDVWHSLRLWKRSFKGCPWFAIEYDESASTSSSISDFQRSVHKRDSGLLGEWTEFLHPDVG